MILFLKMFVCCMYLCLPATEMMRSAKGAEPIIPHQKRTREWSVSHVSPGLLSHSFMCQKDMTIRFPWWSGADQIFDRVYTIVVRGPWFSF